MASGAKLNVLLVVKPPNFGVNWKNPRALGALQLFPHFLRGIVCCIFAFALLDMSLEVEFPQGFVALKPFFACWTPFASFLYSFSLVAAFHAWKVTS